MRALFGLAALWLCASAQAQGLDDPTRPPPGFRGGAGATRPAGSPEGLVLQSVIISDTNRSAIISGEHVALGGKIGAARLALRCLGRPGRLRRDGEQYGERCQDHASCRHWTPNR